MLGFNDSIDAYPYDAGKAKQLITDAGVAGQDDSARRRVAGRWLNDRDLLEAVAGYWTDSRPRRRTADVRSSAPTSTCCSIAATGADAIYVSSSNDILDPDRQLTTYYQAGGIGSSNTDARSCPALIDQGRQQLDPADRAAIYKQAVKIAYDGAYFVCPGEQPGSLRSVERMTLDTSGRLEAARQGNVRLQLSWSTGTVGSGSRVMGRYIARRLVQGLVVIFGVTVFVFVITRLVGDP